MINKIQKLSKELDFKFWFNNGVFFYKFNDCKFEFEYLIPITNFPKFKEWIERTKAMKDRGEFKEQK